MTSRRSYTLLPVPRKITLITAPSTHNSGMLDRLLSVIGSFFSLPTIIIVTTAICTVITPTTPPLTAFQFHIPSMFVTGTFLAQSKRRSCGFFCVPRRSEPLRSLHFAFPFKITKQMKQKHKASRSVAAFQRNAKAAIDTTTSVNSSLLQNPQLQQQQYQSSLIGGHYAGLSATFDASDGRFIPIDERYIPASLLEWGYPPSTLEVLVSETMMEFSSDDGNSLCYDSVDPHHHSLPRTDTFRIKTLTRHITTILPATGCDVDNLDMIRTQEEWTNGHAYSFHHCHDGDDGAMSTQLLSNITLRSHDGHPCDPADMSLSATSTLHCNGNNQHSEPILHIETCFGWTSTDNDDQSTVNEKDVYRTRISFDVVHRSSGDADKTACTSVGWTLMNPIYVSLERQLPVFYSADTATTTMFQPNYDGGFDSRTVSQWLGPILQRESARSFPTIPNVTNWSWQRCGPRNSKTPLGPYYVVMAKNDTNDTTNSRVNLFLPGNLTVSLYRVYDTDITEDSPSNNQSERKQYSTIEIGHITGQNTTATPTDDAVVEDDGDTIQQQQQQRRHVISYTIPDYRMLDHNQFGNASQRMEPTIVSASMVLSHVERGTILYP
jgi:hypothetical protein